MLLLIVSCNLSAVVNAQESTDNTGRRGSTTYRIERNAPLQIGDGGPKLSFHVLNGDVYIQKSKI
jgi:hypothetical protein